MNRKPDPNDELLRQRVRRALQSIERPAPGLVRRCADAVARESRRRPVVPAPIAWMALSLVSVVVVVAVLVQHQLRGGVGPVETPPATATARDLVYALTGGNEVLALDRSTLHTRWTAQAGAVPASTIRAGSMMALSRDASVLYVLPPSDDSGGHTLVLYDAASGHSLGSIALSAAGGTSYRSLAVHPQTGDVYVVGQDTGHIVVTVVDPVQRVVLATQATRTLPPVRSLGPGVPHQALISSDGSRLYYSYSGPDSDRTGIDWAGISGPRLTPCPSSGGAACIPGPGQGFALLGNGAVLFGDAMVPPQIVEADAGGSVVRRFASGLAGVFTDVTLDATGSHLLVVGDCSATGGVTSVDPGTGQVQTLATPQAPGAGPSSGGACGQRAQLVSAGALAVSPLTGARASSQSPGTVELIDTHSGAVLRSAAFSAEIADLLALR